MSNTYCVVFCFFSSCVSYVASFSVFFILDWPFGILYRLFTLNLRVTPTPYGCNDKIDGISILSSPTCRSVNVMDIFNSAPWRKRSHGHYTSPIFHKVSLNDLLVVLPFR